MTSKLLLLGLVGHHQGDRVIFFQAQFDVPRIGNFWIQDGFIDYEFTLSNQPRTAERCSDICDWRFIFAFRASVNLVLETVRFFGMCQEGILLTHNISLSYLSSLKSSL